MRKILTVAILFMVIITSCKKDEYDQAKQLATDEKLINEFVVANKIENVKRTEDGLYYVIIEPGTGNVVYNANTAINVKYTGRLLNGSVFDSGDTTIKNQPFTLGELIYGWQLGIPLIQKGGKIRLLVPSYLAYGQKAAGSIPANSVLDFDVELK
ncbi:FKBP-type peptidyl-prolyl cis-trans isomerase [Arcticibacter eurypsychrophilus]|uniref:FKBP-type peptidyl-prolyl cis-trans isomerase n=1 Tax=Arcticibacter eurypsychrophilus TaxID=1434752 RepID=UPI00084D62ED|nr:FKBP-type peptidyl-prolyl cis-trans isomerase [Arcticibacter eurypsychrophilus]